ncbi:MAG: hypothetical protein ABIN96_06960, partial [Rubrivivax sp.]
MVSDLHPDAVVSDAARTTSEAWAWAQARARALPKVVLHEHLDGSLRPATLLELLRLRGVEPPAAEPAALAAWFNANAHAGSLEKYLQGFALTVHAMASPEALQRVALEAVLDAHADGAVLADFRIAPLLFEAHGLSGEATVQALLAGLTEGRRRTGLPTGLIVCAMRHLPPSESVRAARLALAFAAPSAPAGNAGVSADAAAVIGFDLAGAERGHPAAEHERALALLRDAGLPMTLHAGEADAAERVLEAGRLGARRIGHGVRLVDALHEPAGAALVEAVRALDLHLEVCPTSNVHTGAAASLAAHPIVPLWRAGISLSYHTDNRLMSCISHSDEAANLLSQTPLTEADLLAMTL